MPRAAHRRDLRHRIRENIRIGQRLVGQLMHEARVRPILQQPPHKIREQVAMPANRRVDAAVIAVLMDQPFVQPLTHAVQALELEVARVPCPFEDGGDRQRVVRRERRIDVFGVEHVARDRHIRHVGRRLAREQRIVGQPGLLRPLDLTIPIGPFDQPRRDPPTGACAEIVGPADHRPRALSVRLHRHAEPVPALQRGERRDVFDDFETHFEPFGLLRIDRQRDPGLCRLHRQPFEHFGQCGYAPVPMRHFVARVQRRQFDRDRVPRRRIPADRRNRITV